MALPKDIEGTEFDVTKHNLIDGVPELTTTGKFRKVRGENTPEEVTKFLASVEEKPVAPQAMAEPVTAGGIDCNAIGIELGAEVTIENETTVFFRKGRVDLCVNPKAHLTPEALKHKLAQFGIR